MPLSGIKSLDIYEPVLNKKKSRTKVALRWTKLFYLDSGSGGQVEIATTFAEMLAQAIHSALEPSEDVFVAKSIREFAVRVTLDGETVTVLYYFNSIVIKFKKYLNNIIYYTFTLIFDRIRNINVVIEDNRYQKNLLHSLMNA